MLNDGDKDVKCNCDDAAMVVTCLAMRDAGKLRLCDKEKCTQLLIGRDTVNDYITKEQTEMATRL